MVSVKLTTNASDLYRACARLATELAQLPGITDEPGSILLTGTRANERDPDCRLQPA
jgi:hypothetical protein